MACCAAADGGGHPAFNFSHLAALADAGCPRTVVYGHGFLWPFFFGALTCVGLGFALIFSLDHFKERYKAILSAAEAASSDRNSFIKVFGSSTGGLPGWLRFLDTEQPAWLNDATRVLWPYIDKAASAWAFHDNALEKLLNSQSFWKPKWLAASGVIPQSLALGQVPPKITSIKVYGHGGQNPTAPANALVADITFDWASKMHMQLSMKGLSDVAPGGIFERILHVVYRTVRIKVLVRNLVARGHLRAVITPLLDQIPVAGSVRVSFLGPPTISYSVTSFGANPMIIPGLEAWLNAFIADQVLEPFIFPQGLTLNIAEFFGMNVPTPAIRPQGLLCLTIKSAQNVPRMDFFGLSDPYIRLWLSHKLKRRTSIKGYTLSPVWNEDFKFLVHDPESQRLTLELWGKAGIQFTLIVYIIACFINIFH
jgi:hypothetical protein